MRSHLSVFGSDQSQLQEEEHKTRAAYVVLSLCTVPAYNFLRLMDFLSQMYFLN